MTARLLVLLAAALALSCLGRPVPQVVWFHTLSPTAMTGGAAPAKLSARVEVMPVQLPELLQRPQIVIQKGEGVHVLSSAHRWGNTLEKDMQAVLTEDLAILLGQDAVAAYPSGEGFKADYRLALDVRRLDGELGKALHVQATWMVTETATGRAVLRRGFALDQPVNGPGYEDLVVAHSRALEALGREIAAGVVDLAGPEKAPSP